MPHLFAVNRPALSLALLYLLMGLANELLEPAYTGYLVAYGIFIALTGPQLIAARPQRGAIGGPSALLWTGLAIVVLAISIDATPAFRDLFRDGGAIFSFMFGLFVIPRALGENWERSLFAGLSLLTVFITAWTILAAASAYLAGVGAYEWRGEYVPFAHNWLPYLLIVEYIRSRCGASTQQSVARMGLCVLAMLLSLSRTGVVLMAVFGMVTVGFRARRWLFTGRGILLLITALAAAAAILPQLVALDVVQQRIDAGVGEDDLSLAWRAMEVAAAQDYLSDGGWWRWMFGYGLGARLPLPVGILDFADNTSIPHLHNSYWTLILKFGLVGAAFILVNLGVLFIRAWLVRGGAPALLAGGGWIMAFVLATAVVLQGLTEWSHLTFLGIACAMLSKAGRSERWILRPATVSAQPPVPATRAEHRLA